MRFDRNLFHRQNRRRRTVIITQSARYYNKRKTASLRLLIIVRYTNTLTYLLTYTEWQANCPNTYKTFIANINIRSRFFLHTVRSSIVLPLFIWRPCPRRRDLTITTLMTLLPAVPRGCFLLPQWSASHDHISQLLSYNFSATTAAGGSTGEFNNDVTQLGPGKRYFQCELSTTKTR